MGYKLREIFTKDEDFQEKKIKGKDIIRVPGLNPVIIQMFFEKLYIFILGGEIEENKMRIGLDKKILVQILTYDEKRNDFEIVLQRFLDVREINDSSQNSIKV